MTDQSTTSEEQDDQQDGEGTGGQGGLSSLLDELPFDGLKDALQEAFSSLVESAGDRLTDVTEKLTDVGEGSVTGKAAKKGAESAAEGGSGVGGALKGGFSGAMDKAKGLFGGGSDGEDEEDGGGGGGSGGGKGTKVTNIIEEIDVGVPISVAYNAWTEFQEYSGFMKKVDNVEQEEETKVNFKAQVFWSHREWEATIIEQVPDEKIVWESKGEKGHVDGTVTFHELAPRLTRILVVLEYHPQGFFEHVGNLWRAQGRRARLELKHFRRHVMTNVIVEPEEVEGWRGEIHDKDVERSHDEVVEEEQQADDEPTDEYDDDVEDEEEAPEDDYEEEPEDVEDDYVEDDEVEEEAPEDDYVEEAEEPEEEDEEPAPRRRRGKRSR
jgi:hypothetical protein